MFLLAWLLYSVLLSHSIHTTLSALISATIGDASPIVTGTWVLLPGDPPQASQGFIIQLLSDEPSGEKLEDDSTVDPQRMSTGAVTLTATSTGTQRLQIVLSAPTSILASSSEFTIVNLDAEGTETGPPASTSTSPASSSMLSNTASELNPSKTGTSTFPSSGTTSESTQIHSHTSMTSSSASPSIPTETTKKVNLTAIILAAIFAFLFIILLVAVGLLCRRRRRRLMSMVSSNPSEAIEPFREYTIGPGIPSHRRKHPGLAVARRPVPVPISRNVEKLAPIVLSYEQPQENRTRNDGNSEHGDEDTGFRLLVEVQTQTNVEHQEAVDLPPEYSSV